MTAPKVRADFDLLNNIATRFRGESDNIKQMQSSITQAMNALEGGDWVGPGATAFYAEMRESVLPAGPSKGPAELSDDWVARN